MSDADSDDESQGSSEEEEEIQAEITALKEARLRKKKKEKKKEREAMAKIRRRKALGMDLQAIDLPDHVSFVQLDNFLIPSMANFVLIYRIRFSLSPQLRTRRILKKYMM